MLTDIFNRLMNDYGNEKLRPLKNNHFAEYIRNDARKEIANLPFIGDDYLVKASVGQGNWADIPSIAIMDKRITTTPQEGVYIIYLLSKDCKKLYLTLNQGSANSVNAIGKPATIRQFKSIANQIIAQNPNTSFTPHINNSSKPDLKSYGADLYEEGAIFYKGYDQNALPSEDDLQSDLKELLNIYKKYTDSIADSTINPENDKFGARIESNSVKGKYKNLTQFPYNRIIFGAPGTGKSFKLEEERKVLLTGSSFENYERVTFHPDYSYANFVGTYKPVMAPNIYLDPKVKKVISVLNDKTLTAQQKYDKLWSDFCDDDGSTRLAILLGIYTDEPFITKKKDGSRTANNNIVERNHGRAIRKYVWPITKSQSMGGIAYKYVPGPFMRTYVKAVKSLHTDDPQPYLLIIEEVNRANVAAVFGDVFQLLDRNSDGESEYSIQASEDIKNYLSEELGGDPNDYLQISIPRNMFIWATMNSADQGVFPMDTAFKRRWDFTYIGIDDNDKDIQGKMVEIAGKTIEWNKLRKAINDFLADEKINEDKQLGPYFISRDIVVPKIGNMIDSTKFCAVFKSKVLMYLFEDAAKQKRSKLFDGVVGAKRYSEICKAFDKDGIKIFHNDIQSKV